MAKKKAKAKMKHRQHQWSCNSCWQLLTAQRRRGGGWQCWLAHHQAKVSTAETLAEIFSRAEALSGSHKHLSQPGGSLDDNLKCDGTLRHYTMDAPASVPHLRAGVMAQPQLAAHQAETAIRGKAQAAGRAAELRHQSAMEQRQAEAVCQ